MHLSIELLLICAPKQKNEEKYDFASGTKCYSIETGMCDLLFGPCVTQKKKEYPTTNVLCTARNHREGLPNQDGTNTYIQRIVTSYQKMYISAN